MLCSCAAVRGSSRHSQQLRGTRGSPRQKFCAPAELITTFSLLLSLCPATRFSLPTPSRIVVEYQEDTESNDEQRVISHYKATELDSRSVDAAELTNSQDSEGDSDDDSFSDPESTTDSEEVFEEDEDMEEVSEPVRYLLYTVN